MPFCPKCEVEYRAGFTTCADCDVDLVDRLPEQKNPEWGDSEPVELTRMQKSAEARMLCEALIDSDIPCTIRGDEGKDMLGSILGASMFDGTGLNDVVVSVPEDRLNEAKDILNAFFPDDNPEGELEFMECSECGCPVDDEDEECPACGEKLAE